MPTRIVPKTRTPLDAAVAVQLLEDAYLEEAGKKPTPGVLALMGAQTSHESGAWQSLYCNNWGGNKATASAGLVFQAATHEMGPDGKLVLLHPPDPACNFQAFETPLEGAKEYVRRLHRRPHWWNGLHTESVDDFVAGLVQPPKYFTADPEKYKAALRRRLAELLPLFESRIAIGWVPPTSWSEPPPPDDDAPTPTEGGIV